MDPLEECSALPVYEAALEFVPRLPVVDLGCGTGRFAELLRRSGVTGYRGFDFAPAVIEEARRYVPSFEFDVADLREWEHGPEMPDECCYVILEVLEHLDDDRDLLARLQPGQPVVFSVPNFWSESHVRVFPTAEDAIDRYGDLLDFGPHKSIEFDTSDRNTIHVFSAVRR